MRFAYTNIAMLLCTSAAAQTGGTYDMSWNSIGGGGRFTGGTYVLSGTTSHFDVGDSSGGTYELRSGFWQPSATGAVCPGGMNGECDDGTVCTQDVCDAGVCENPQRPFGDVNNDGSNPADVFDILCVLDGFAEVYNPPCTLSNLDVSPCPGGDGAVDVFDILAVLDAFAGMNVCGCAAGP